MRKSSSIRVDTALTWFSSRSPSRRAAEMTCLHKLEFSLALWSRNLRSLDVAESSPLNYDIAVGLAGLFDDFVTDILSLAIAIRPNDEQASVSSVVRNVLRN